MNQRQLKKWIKKEIQSVLNQVGEKIEVVVSKKVRQGFGYEKTKNGTAQLLFNPKPYTHHYYKEVQTLSLTLKESVMISTLHELGHHRDKEYNQKQNERKKHYETWSHMNTPKGYLMTPTYMAMKDMKALPHMVQHWQITYEMECWAWELASMLNQQHKFVSETSFVAKRNDCLHTYSKLLFEVVDAYQTLKNEHVKTA